MKATRSPLARDARKRARHRAAWKRAPKHPAAPEARLRHACTLLMRAWHARIKEAVLRAARVHAEHVRRHRTDAEEHVAPEDVIASSVFATLENSRLKFLRDSPFRRMADEAAAQTAKSATTQTRKALDLGRDFDPDLDTERLGIEGIERMAELMDSSIDRASEVLDGWTGELRWLDEDEEPDLDKLDEDLDDGLGGIMGKALQWAGLAFGVAFADMVAGAQKDAGVTSAIWLTQMDSHVRPAHAALDGVEFTWDEPPLLAADADCEEDCFPGEDFGCRCVASPISPEAGEDD